jgi:proteasome lid subunit RPN8/RPN11
VTSRAALAVPTRVRQALVAHARRDRPAECCGLLLGLGRRVQFAVAMPNTDPRPTHYRIDDAAHISLRRALRGWVPRLSVLGVYHSHPAGDAHPSPTDVAQAMYPDWVYVIIGLASRQAAVRAFRIRRGRVREVAIRRR